MTLNKKSTKWKEIKKVFQMALKLFKTVTIHFWSWAEVILQSMQTWEDLQEDSSILILSHLNLLCHLDSENYSTL